MNKIYIYTCDKNLFLLNACITMINKYYNPNPLIVILGFSDPKLVYKNVIFNSLGKSQDINKWSKYLYDYFINIEEKFILTLFEDMFPIDEVNVNGIDKILKYMEKNDDIGYCTLCNQPSFGRDKSEEIIINDDNLFLFKRPKNCNSKINLQVNLWNKNYFLKYLSHHKTPWKFEIELSKIAKNDNFHTLSTSHYYIKTPCVFPSQINTALSQNHWLGKISVVGIRFNDIEELIRKGFLDKNKLIYGSYKYYIDYKNINRNNFNLKKFILNAPNKSPMLKTHWEFTFYSLRYGNTKKLD